MKAIIGSNIGLLDSRYLKLDATNDPITGSLLLQPTVDSLTALVVNDTDSNNVLTVDTINNRVGIGVTTPEYQFTVKSVANSYPFVVQASDGSNLFLLRETSAGDSIFYIRDKGNVTRFQFNTAGDSYMDGGNVGIGTTAPGAKLHVSGGNILLDNNYYIQSKDSTSNIRNVFGLASSNVLYIDNPTTGEIRLATISASTIRMGGASASQGVVLDTPAADAVNTLRNSAFLDLRSRYWNGSASTVLDATIKYIVTGTTPVSRLAFTVGTTEGMSILNSGNVGIGTTNPQRTLDVNGFIAAGNTTDGITIGLNGTVGTIYGLNTTGDAYNDLELRTGASPMGIMIKATTGNVGIGTTAPETILDVKQANAGSDTAIHIWNSDESVSLDETASLIFKFSDTNSVNLGVKQTAGYIRAGKEDTYATAGTADSFLAFATSQNGVDNERLRITQSGNVGIGTTGPGATLQVKGVINNTQTIGTIFNPNGAMSSLASIAEGVEIAPTFSNLVVGSEVTDFYALRIKPVTNLGVGNITNNYGLYIDAGTTGVNNYGAYIAGNVGIGVTAPLAKLHVVGTADDEQLVVKGYSTQTTNLQEWQSSAAGVLASVSGTGVFTNLVGVTDPAGDAYGTKTQTTVTATAGAYAGTIRNSYQIFRTAGTQNFTGYVEGCEYGGLHTGSGTVTNMIGGAFSLGMSSTGNCTTGRVIQVESYGLGAGVFTTLKGINISPLNAYNAPVTSIGIDINADTTASGTTKYGLKVGSISGATTNYAIYTQSGNILFNAGYNTDTDFSVNALNYEALLIDASNDSIDIMHTTAGKIGFFGQTPATRPAHIADPTGGATVDIEARAAIASINALIATLGLSAAS